ncbi:MAG TPA: metallophosphoesterase [Geobacteraceae bacterium]|nr:metallophosphoesterase [Geobacteraceae bacterium]
MNMRYRNLRLIGLLFAMILPLQFAACGGGTGTPTPSNKDFPVVVFSDIHFNPLYDPSLFKKLVSADAGEWAGIFQTSGMKGPSAWGADTNYPLLVLALAGIQRNMGSCPLVIFTGDLLGHYLPQTFFSLYDPDNASHPTPEDVAAMKAFTDKTVAFVMQQVRSSVGAVPVMFALGNADSYTGLGPDSSFLSNTAEMFYSQFVNGTIDQQTFLNTYKSGGYYSAEPSGTNLTVIGLNTFEFSPAFKDVHAEAVAAELSWFDATLASAKARGRKVWLLMHVPPGADKYSTAQSVDADGHITTATMMWNQDYQNRFLDILAKYPGLIALTLTAHTHMDEYRIMSPGNVAETTPSVAPYFGNNPAFKVFTISSDTWKATDYTSLNYDLATTPEQFSRYYTFSAEYLMQGYLDDSLARLYPALVSNHDKRKFYRDGYFSGHNYTVPLGTTFDPITDKTWPVYWCGIGKMGQQELMDCVNSY